MDTILALYPVEFNSLEKFSRKILKITKNIENFRFICPADHNNFLKKLVSDSLPNVSVIVNENWSLKDITHAIIFDDGEVFADELEVLQSHSIPIRFIKIAITRVINIKTETKYAKIKSSHDYEYIGRGSYWGNPYSMYDGGDDREEVIRKYKYDFENDLFPKKSKSEVYKLAGKRLGCFCKPEACHGDILADFLNKFDDGK